MVLLLQQILNMFLAIVDKGNQKCEIRIANLIPPPTKSLDTDFFSRQVKHQAYVLTNKTESLTQPFYKLF